MTANQRQQQQALQWLEARKGTVLVPHKRLAFSLLHQQRQALASQGQRGWQGPSLKTLGQWARELWKDGWAQEQPAPRTKCLAVWQQVVGELPPPGDLRADPALCAQCDQAYGVMLRSGLDPAQRPADADSLPAWRAQASGLFSRLLAAEGYFHPELLWQRLAEMIGRKAVGLDAAYLALGFELASPTEKALLRALGASVHLQELPPPAGQPKTLEAVLLPEVGQEELHLGRELARAIAEAGALHQVALVLPDIEGYLPLARRVLERVLGPNPSHGPGRLYNLALGDKLLQTPLVQAGLLPLTLTQRPRREEVLEFFLSPYYQAWRGSRRLLARADLIWREGYLWGPLDKYLQAVRRRNPDLAAKMRLAGREADEVLAPLAGGRRPLALWLGSLQEVWSSLGFPLRAGEGDQIAWKDLRRVLAELSDQAPDLMMDRGQFRQWLEAALGDKRTTPGGDELAGVQVLGLREAQGLGFERMLVPGLTASALPAPVRRLPLLAPQERRRVQGGSVADQYRYGARAFASLLAAASGLRLSRPRTQGDEELAPSPFWPAGQERPDRIRLWQAPPAAWLRAPWVKGAWQGRREPPPIRRESPLPGVLPDPSRATDLALVFRCPLQFLLACVLNLAPLPEASPGIEPAERGKALHRILARFASELNLQGLDLVEDQEAVVLLLASQVDQEVQRRGEGPAWRLERERLLGRGPGGGLLGVWLQMEQQRWQEGWRIRHSELAFEGPLAGLPMAVRGRIDRLDYHPEQGWVCWDYKSGRLPAKGEVVGSFIECQLPIYLCAMQEGLIPQARMEGPAAAGFCCLASQGEVSHQQLNLDGDGWARVVAEMAAALGEAAAQMQQGQYPRAPRWRGDNLRRRLQTCVDCPFHPLLCPGWSPAEDDHAA